MTTPAADQIALEAVDVGYAYPSGVEALRGIALVAGCGQFVVVLGPNGSGKTTLLRHFTGMLRPSQGRVYVRGRDLATQQRSWVHQHVGFLCQDPNDQLFGATVGEDVAFGPRNLGLDRHEVVRRVMASLHTVGLSALVDRPIPALSFGEKRRAALAGVLAMEPTILVLDEPTAGLDPLRASQLLALLHRLSRQEGKTVMMATHDVDVVPAYADLIYVMCDGRVVAAGPPPAVFAQSRLMLESHMRLPRVAHALHVAGQELGLALVELPLTVEYSAGIGDWAGWQQEAPGSRERPPRLTTGGVAAAAARAALELLLRGRAPHQVELRSPLGAVLEVPVAWSELGGVDGDRIAVAEVVKPSVDPADPTNGARIQARVQLTPAPGIVVAGAAGIGRVVRAGLPVPIGEAAINPAPRQMIADSVGDLVPPGHGLLITLICPNGEEMARRTGNADAGIVGGIAILGGLGAPGYTSSLGGTGEAGDKGYVWKGTR